MGQTHEVLVNLLSLPVALAAGITAYVGLYHFFLHRRRPRKSDLYFALTCLCMVGYDVSAAFHYSALDIETGGFWQRWEIVWAVAMGMPFLLFVNEQVGLNTSRRAIYALCVFPAAAIVTALERFGWILSDEAFPKNLRTPWGETLVYELRLGPGFTLLESAVPLMLLYCLWVALGAFHLRGGKWVKRDRRSTPLTVASIGLLLALGHDLLIAHGTIPGAYIFELAFLGVTVVMSFSMGEELSEASRTRRTLEVTERRESTILSAIQDAVITTDLEGRITHLNPGAEKILAVRLADVEGKHLSAFVELTSPENNEIVKDPVRYALGRPPNPYGKLPQLVTTDGHERRVDLGGAPLKDEEGRVEGAIVVMRDVTLQHLALDSLEHAKKMESMGQLAGGAAHDLNNLLTPIMSYVELVQKDVLPTSKSAKFLVHVQDAAQRAAALTRQLLALSRKQVLDVQVVPLAEFVRQTVPILKRLLGDAKHLEVSISDDVGRVRVDLGQLEQVLLNLTSNARDALSEGGKVTLKVRQVGENEAAIEVSDTGTGMDRETVSRIFEPFFTTKERGKGTGLGLASVRGIVEQHGGSIYVDSELGEGTSFEIVLPTTQVEQRKSSVRGVPRGDFVTGNESILVVEDDQGVRSLVEDALSQLGYRVFIADGLAMAVAVAETEHLDLLLTDVVLPGADGTRVRDAVFAHQRISCLFMTGHADDRLGERGILSRGTQVLRKPFTVRELAARVRQILDTQEARDHRNQA